MNGGTNSQADLSSPTVFLREVATIRTGARQRKPTHHSIFTFRRRPQRFWTRQSRGFGSSSKKHHLNVPKDLKDRLRPFKERLPGPTRPQFVLLPDNRSVTLILTPRTRST